MWSVPRFWVFPWFFSDPPTKHILSHRKKNIVSKLPSHNSWKWKMGPFSFRFGGVFFHFHDGRKGRFGSISKGSKLDIITFNSTMKALVKGEEWQRALSSMDSPVGSVLWGFGMVFCRGFNVGIHQVLRGSRGGGYGYCLKFSWFGNTWIHSWIYIYIYIYSCVDKGGLTKVSPFFVYDPISQADFWNPGQKRWGRIFSMAKRADSIQFHEQIFGFCGWWKWFNELKITGLPHFAGNDSF